MKQLYLCLIVLVFCFNYLNAQTVNVTGTCYYVIDGDFAYSGDINGKPSFSHIPEGTNIYLISWTGTRWELTAEDTSGYILIGSHNNLDTPNPPATSLLPWTPDDCSPAGIFSGDGTSTTMRVKDVKTEEIIISPIPSSNFITIKGLKNREHYTIYNLFGQFIQEGTIGSFEKIDINNYSNGLYILKLNSGSTIKFIKN